MTEASRNATTLDSLGRESQEQRNEIMSTHHGILLHVVFSTKFRKPYLAEEWRDDLFGYIGGIEDHVHLYLRIHPEFAISKTIQLLKANSSKGINEQRKLPGRFERQGVRNRQAPNSAT